MNGAAEGGGEGNSPEQGEAKPALNCLKGNSDMCSKKLLENVQVNMQFSSLAVCLQCSEVL